MSQHCAVAELLLNDLLAVFWDVDGTLADTEMDGHRPAFNQAFKDLDLPFHWDADLYNKLLPIAGGLHRVRIYAKEQGLDLTDAQLAQLKERKRFHYFERVQQGFVRFRPGVQRMLHLLHGADIQQWIVTSSGQASVHALLDAAGDRIPPFVGVISADDVSAGKPSPEGYRLAVERSGVKPAHALAIEDSAAGFAAARDAGLSCLLTPSPWDPDLCGDVPGAAAVMDHLGDQDCPLTVRQGPPCEDAMVTLKYLQSLLLTDPS